MSKANQNYEVINEDTIECVFTSVNYDQVYLDKLCEKINNSITSLSEGYLWHKDEFKVFVPIKIDNNEDIPHHLVSRTCFGDNIEDEWFIVYIILKLSNQYKDLIIQVKDNDGDFLLIEAADYLPSWANPETTENRVFIYNNHIHLIPPNVAPLNEKLMLTDAIQYILKSDQTKASAEIEAAILKRIGNYPEKLKDDTHNALVKMPLEIAALLKVKPNLIAPIINAYYHHDVIDVKAFKNVSYNSWVTVPLKFTKCLYAMLLFSKVANCVRQPFENDKKIILGMKLAFGYNIIMKKSSDIYTSKEYHRFLNSLKENGYFKNNIEGSEEYKKLLQDAKDFFSAIDSPIASNTFHDITKIIATDEYLKTKELLRNENVILSDIGEDNDDWLNLHPEQLNELLNSRYGNKMKFQKGDVLTPQTFTTELSNFLKQTSDVEGIETNKNDQLENCIDFDADQFKDCVEKMLKLLVSNNDNETESIHSDFSEETMSQSEGENEFDEEIKIGLHGAAENLSDSKIILDNMTKSMKEEKAAMGPSSNLISNLGLSKIDFLDSDDD